MIEIINILQKVQFLMRKADSTILLTPSESLEIKVIQDELENIHEITQKIERELNAKNN